MIKLTLTPKTQPIIYFFDKKTVIIGNPYYNDDSIDLPIARSEINPSHIKIEEDDGQFIAFNLAKDPHSTINGVSFIKRNVKSGDLIQVGQVQIHFEGVVSEQTIAPNPYTPSKISCKSNSLDFDKEIQHLEELIGLQANEELVYKELLDCDIDTLLKKVEDLEYSLINNELQSISLSSQNQVVLDVVLQQTPQETSNKNTIFYANKAEHKILEKTSERIETPAQATSSVTYEPKSWEQKHGEEKTAPKRQSLKDYYLSEFDDENENWNPLNEKNAPTPPTRITLKWKPLMSAAGVMISLSFLAMGLFYLSIMGRSGEEEIKAAEAVADVAMSINYAQVNHTLSQNQNWSDPDFLKNNLASLLMPGYSSLAEVDTHGQFQNTGYILRIYTSSDLQHYMVMAQPNASLLQWLIPKSTIIVDSKAMELRKITDLKSLNRLLVNPTLDTSNSTEISQLVKQAKLIPLNLLSEKRGFTTPQGLTLGADNLIYNALRYFHFGEELMKKAIKLYESNTETNEIAYLKQEIESFSKFRNIVLYSSEGLKTAQLGQRAIATFMPQVKFNFAYIQFDSKGLFSASQLLMEENPSELALLDSTEQVISHDSKKEIEQPSANKSQLQDIDEPTLQISDPIFEGMKNFDKLFLNLHVERQKALKDINDQMTNLINTENKTAISNFPEKLHQLQKQQEYLSKKYQNKIIMAISLLSLREVISVEQGPNINSKAEISEREIPNGKPFLEPIHPYPSLKINEDIDKNHPLFYKLTAIYTARQQALKPLSDQMLVLLNDQTKNGTENKKKLEALEKKYEDLAEDTQERVIKAISALHKEYNNMPLAQFLSYVKASGLESFIKESLQRQSKEQKSENTAEEAIPKRIDKIRQAKSLKELEDSLTEAAQLLTLEKIPDTSLLISYQNKVHSETTNKLDEFLLSTKQLNEDELTEKNRPTVVRIMKSAWVTDPDELDYYLNEFDLLIQR